MLETIIAMSILIVGVVSMISMVSAMLIARTAAEYETVATNLAREGIEVARNARDSNWMKNVPFDQGIFNSKISCLSFEPTNTDGNHPNGWRLTVDDLAYSHKAIYRYTTGPYAGFYTQICTGETAKWATASTLFNRQLLLQDICLNGDIRPGDDPCPAGTSVGIQVLSQVGWTERGRLNHKVWLYENIYDWR